jgi:hypothetical protein
MPFALATALWLSQETDKENLTSGHMSFSNNERILIHKRIRTEYDAKYNGAYSKMKIKEKRQLKARFVEELQHVVMQRILQSWIRFEEEESQRKQREFLEAIAEKQDKEMMAKDEDIINRIAELILRTKTFVSRQK